NYHACMPGSAQNDCRIINIDLGGLTTRRTTLHRDGGWGFDLAAEGQPDGQTTRSQAPLTNESSAILHDRAGAHTTRATRAHYRHRSTTRPRGRAPLHEPDLWLRVLAEQPKRRTRGHLAHQRSRVVDDRARPVRPGTGRASLSSWRASLH